MLWRWRLYRYWGTKFSRFRRNSKSRSINVKFGFENGILSHWSFFIDEFLKKSFTVNNKDNQFYPLNLFSPGPIRLWARCMFFDSSKFAKIKKVKNSILSEDNTNKNEWTHKDISHSWKIIVDTYLLIQIISFFLLLTV